MIKIIYEPYEVLLEGHANSAPKGKDLVCAGVSVLTTSLAEILNENKDEWLEYCSVSLGEGKSAIKVTPKPNREKEVRAAFETILRGYMLIASSFPSCVKLNKKCQ